MAHPRPEDPQSEDRERSVVPRNNPFLTQLDKGLYCDEMPVVYASRISEN